MSDSIRPSEPNPYPGPYKERFPIGCAVQVADEETLNHFKATWKYHHPLDVAQLEFAGLITTVRSIGYYHGGDVLYGLRDTGAYTWHDACLRVPGDLRSTMDEMNECEHLDLVNISELGENSLRLIVAELSVSERTDLPPPPVPDARLVEHGKLDRLFEVSWSKYVAYNVLNKSYSEWESSAESKGNRFRLYQKSRYLDFVRETQNVGFLAPNHKHWGLVCERHVIDVISEEEPNVGRYGSR
ncbi:MAG: hypothetical protein WA431_08425 [Candidatus Cybelea sp.]